MSDQFYLGKEVCGKIMPDGKVEWQNEPFREPDSAPMAVISAVDRTNKTITLSPVAHPDWRKVRRIPLRIEREP